MILWEKPGSEPCLDFFLFFTHRHILNTHQSCVSCCPSLPQYRPTLSHSTRYCTFPSGVTRLARILTASPPPAQLRTTVPSPPPPPTPIPAPLPAPPLPPPPPAPLWYGGPSRRMRGSSCFWPGWCWWLCWWLWWWCWWRWWRCGVPLELKGYGKHGGGNLQVSSMLREQKEAKMWAIQSFW